MATILVMGGCPAKIRTSDPVHFLGNVLLELGMISPPHLQSSLSAMQAPGKQLQGQLLLAMNAIDAARLDAGLRSQVERKVEHLFGLSNDTTFAYYDNVDLLSQFGGPPTPIDPFPVLWRGCREQPALEHVDATYRRIGTALLRIAPTSQIDRFAFSPQEREVVEMLRQRPMRPVDIVAQLGPRVGQIFVYFMMIMKQVELIEGTQPIVGAPQQPPPQPASARMPIAPPAQPPAPTPQQPAPNPMKITATPSSQSLGRVQLQRQASPRGPMVVEEQVAVVSSRDDRASPPSGAPSPPSGNAFGGSAFGGSAFAAPPPPAQIQQPASPQPLPPQRQPTPPAGSPVITSPAQPAAPFDLGAMIVQTIQQSNAPPAMPPTPSQPPPMNMPRAASVPGMPAVSAASGASEPPPSSRGPASVKLTAEQNAMKMKIMERADNITSQDYFQMLGIDRDAGTEQIQKAFFALAKVWHPDRLPAALHDVKDACSKVFTYLTEANTALSDPGKRQDYLKLLKEGGATPEDQQKIQQIIEAATEFQKAEFLLKRNPNDPQAHEIVRRCVMLDDEQTDYVATLTYLDAQRPEWLSREKTMEKTYILDKCIAKSPNNERAYFYRGLLYKRAEEPSKALKDFKKAAELNPRNLDAMREVRLHNMRKESGASNTSKPGVGGPAQGGRPSVAPPAAAEKLGGLFGKFFKK